MRQQRWHPSVAQNVPAGAAKDHFAQSRPAISAHDQEIAPFIEEPREDGFSSAAAACVGDVEGCGNTVAAKVGDQISAQSFRRYALAFLLDEGNGANGGRRLEKIKGIEHGPRGFPRIVPGNNDVLADGLQGCCPRRDKHRASAANDRRLGEVAPGVRNVVAGLSANDQIGGAPLLSDQIGSRGVGRGKTTPFMRDTQSSNTRFAAAAASLPAF